MPGRDSESTRGARAPYHIAKDVFASPELPSEGMPISCHYQHVSSKSKNIHTNLSPSPESLTSSPPTPTHPPSPSLQKRNGGVWSGGRGGLRLRDWQVRRLAYTTGSLRCQYEDARSQFFFIFFFALRHI